jgi:hypothetical protein
MTVILCLIVAVLGIALFFVNGMYRMGLHDRHNLAQFVNVLMLEPGAFEGEREKFLRRVRTLKASGPAALGSMMELELSRYAKRLLTTEATAVNANALWKVNQTDELQGMLDEAEFAASASIKHDERAAALARGGEFARAD